MKTFQELREESSNTLPPDIRRKANSEFANSKLGGHPYFDTFGQGLNLALNILAKYGIEPAEMVSPPLGNKGRVRVPLAFTNKEDAFSPRPIDNSDLILTWDKVRHNGVEIIAYLS